MSVETGATPAPDHAPDHASVRPEPATSPETAGPGPGGGAVPDEGAGTGEGSPGVRDQERDEAPRLFGEPGKPFARSPFLFGLTGALGVFTAWLLVQSLAKAAGVLMLIVVSMFLAVGLNPVVERLQRRRIPRRWSISIVFTGVIGFFVVFGLAIVPPVTTEATQLIESVPGHLTDLRNNETLKRLDADYEILKRVESYLASGDLGTKVAGGILGVGAVVLDAVFSVFTVLVLTLYFLGSLPMIKQYGLRLVPRSRRRRTALIGDQILDGIGGYVGGNVLISVIAGVVSYAFLLIAGAKYALALALLVAIMDLIPMVGATLGAVMVTAVGFLQSAPLGIACAIFFLVYQQVENYVIYPRVMKRSVDVAPALTVIAALVGGALLGILGALLAIPIAAAIVLILREVVIPRQDAA
ncbi:AI-2E family transporter [Bailinhaonella thermotolerans]|uniref:AI-2E family transporter n=1 Tax=Bailinhaonella thermotolerans TaxID=1070861 RepID=A0A3A4AFV4_9ACTN|nr:AI-2E family transporter [Bailinhaonella thermotolerans]RJL24523.1 AI-2E family transporter [Bailinhaonella thermotolerans]